MISFETMKILSKENIDRSLWEALVKESDTATFFQTPVCFDFYEKLPFIQAFVWGLDVEGELQAVIVGYSTKEKNCIKQFFTRRAIIIGGPLLSHNIDHRAFMDFLLQVKDSLSKENIYIEIRNFHDFSACRQDFEHCGFEFVPHLNFHIDTRDTETVLSNMGKSRKRDVKTSLRDGAIIINNPTIAQVRDYYVILKELYLSKVKTPLFSLSFFEELYSLPQSHFILVEYNGNIVGGTVCVELENKAMYEWFACGKDGSSKTIFPSTLATYAAIMYAAEHSIPMFDMMGAGKPNEGYGVRDFKAKFGGKLVEHGRFLNISKPLLFSVGKILLQLYKKVC